MSKKGRVTGIDGIFFKTQNPNNIKLWNQTHLGLNTDAYGSSFEWRESVDPTKKGFTQWSPFKEDTT